MNVYKIGDRVQVLANNSWKNGTINGFTYHHSGEINTVYVNRDDSTHDTDSYNINMPINVRNIPRGDNYTDVKSSEL
jgi:ribosomal protein L21E